MSSITKGVAEYFQLRKMKKRMEADQKALHKQHLNSLNIDTY